MDDDIKNKINEMLQSLQSIHFPSGCEYSGINKLKSSLTVKESELDAIYNLIESHAPGVRYTTVERYQKTLDTLTDHIDLFSNNKNTFKCSNKNDDNNMNIFLDYLTKMPKEWTIVQLTSQYNIKENTEMVSEKCYTSALHLTVLNCGPNQLRPFTITLEPPIDNISGDIIEIRQEMFDILRDNEIHLKKFKNHKKSSRFLSNAEKLIYVDDRNSLNNRLEGLVNVIQNKWLDAWRCLFIGKFVDETIEEKVQKVIEEKLQEFKYQHLSESKKSLLIYLIKGSGYLRLTSSKKGLKYIFPNDEDKNIRCAFIKLMQSKEFNFEEQRTQPLILIIDETLDFMPWEMIDILQKQSVSRVPSLHFAYSLFKQYENTIVNGFMEIYSTSNATYMLNPGLDLNAMQQRMHNFFNYWRPDWSGIVGVEPSEDVFSQTLTTSDIFIYCGHGSGTQFLRGEIIQRTKINSIVFLFGCGSIKLSCVGPEAEICSSYFNYLIASSPCVVGMLWIVTDFETDALATELFSQWIPSEAPTHWSLIAKDKWAMDGSVTFSNEKRDTMEIHPHEPELLRVLANSKRASGKYITRAACVYEVCL